MASTYTVGKNSQYGSAKKRKHSRTGRSEASTLSRQLFFKGGVTPQISPMVFDRAVGRALKARRITTPEQKFFEVPFTSFSNSVTSAITLLSGIGLGDTTTQRAGAKIRITKIEATIQLFLSSTAGGGQDAGKFSIFIQKQCNGVAPIFETAPLSAVPAPYNSNGTNSYPILKNSLFEDQFYIVKDWDYCLDANAGDSTLGWQSDTCHLKCEVPINRVIEYNNGNAQSVADCIRNAIWLGRVGGQAGGATATAWNGLTRIWFTDV